MARQSDLLVALAWFSPRGARVRLDERVYAPSGTSGIGRFASGAMRRGATLRTRNHGAPHYAT